MKSNHSVAIILWGWQLLVVILWQKIISHDDKSCLPLVPQLPMSLFLPHAPLFSSYPSLSWFCYHTSLTYVFQSMSHEVTWPAASQHGVPANPQGNRQMGESGASEVVKLGRWTTLMGSLVILWSWWVWGWEEWEITRTSGQKWQSWKDNLQL